MRRVVFTTISSAVLALGMPLSATVLTAYADEAFAGGTFDWTGFYVGGHAGAISGSTRGGFGGSPPGVTTLTDNAEPAGVGAGFLAGYNHQIGNIVLGLEGDITFSDAGEGFNTAVLAQTLELNQMYSLRARLGYAFDRSLIYVTGGYVRMDTTYKLPILLGNENVKFDGYQVGGGLEHKLTDSLSVRGEYLYSDFGSETISTFPGIPIDQAPQTHTIRAGFAWHLNSLQKSFQATGSSATESKLHEWTGFYLGTHAGLLSGNTRGAVDPSRFPSIRYDSEPSGIAGGVLGGYNHQFGNLVVGLEADATFSDAGDGVTQQSVTATVALNEMYSVRGRLGYATGDTLLYVSGGYAIAHTQYDAPAFFLRDNATFDGFQVGGGVEHMLNPSVSLRGEFLYADFGSQDVLYSNGSKAPQSLETHTVRAALNWHLNSSWDQSKANASRTAEAVAQDWTGFYVGAHAGAVSGSTRGFVPPNPVTADRYDSEPSGVAGGVLGGYNHQIGNVVFGAEADFTFSDAGDGINNRPLPATTEINNMYSVRGRIGYAMGDTLLYGTGGVAWAQAEYEVPADPVNDKVTFGGFQVGGGFEHRLTESLSLRGEYLYSDFGEEEVRYNLTSKADQSLETHTARAALVWNFGIPGL